MMTKARVHRRAQRSSAVRTGFGAAALGLAVLASGCSFSSETATVETAVGGSGSVEQLCATAAQWQQPLVDAGAAGLGPLADAKVSYLQAAQSSAPDTWADNISVILPAWETLVEVIAQAEGDASRIDFEKFRVDFADATANDEALEAFIQARCLG